MSTISGSRQVALAPQALWDALRDPESLGASMPGVQHVEVEDATTFRAIVRPTTGLGTTSFAMRFEVRSEDAPNRMTIAGAGNSGENAVIFELDVELDGSGDDTELRWQAEIRFLGVLASIGQRVLPALAREQIDAVLAAAATRPLPAGS